MDKAKFIKIFDEIFKSNGFKKKGNNWFVDGAELKKLINLQRSNFGSYYYLNFGFQLNSLEPGNLWAHVSYRLASRAKEENQRRGDFLNLDSDINEEQQQAELRFHLKTDVIDLIQKINTEAELLSELNSRRQLNGHLNDIPLSVKKHFGLSPN